MMWSRRLTRAQVAWKTRQSYSTEGQTVAMLGLSKATQLLRAKSVMRLYVGVVKIHGGERLQQYLLN
jgi:hypothetical protein